MVVMSTIAYTGDDKALARISDLKSLKIDKFLYDLVRLGNFSPAVSGALYDRKSPYYLGGKIEGLPALPHVEFQKLQFNAVK